MDDGLIASCVGLDGTLACTDLLIESALRAAQEQPMAGVGAVLNLASWRVGMKQRLAEMVDLRVDLLPYEPAVLELATAAKAAGRHVVLATASNREYAEQVAAHLGLFDAVHASDESTNRSSAAKAQCLVQAYGERGFDSVGESAKDLAVWRRTRRAIVVNAGPQVRSAVARLGVPYELLNSRGFSVGQLRRALRPHQSTLIWLACPLLLYWLARIWSIARRGLMHDDPLVFAVEDRGSQVIILTCVLVMWFAI